MAHTYFDKQKRLAQAASVVGSRNELVRACQSIIAQVDGLGALKAEWEADPDITAEDKAAIVAQVGIPDELVALRAAAGAYRDAHQGS